tara:strand:+ start:18585 stop:21605 length:3021 start_codon:yes stop_codon:yes gene_type:complete
MPEFGPNSQGMPTSLQPGSQATTIRGDYSRPAGDINLASYSITNDLGGSLNHPEPRKIRIYNQTSFGGNAPTEFLFEFDAPGPIDFIRYRMDRIWNKDPYSNNGIIGGSAGPINVQKPTPPAGPGDSWSIELNFGALHLPTYSQGLFYRHREKVTIGYLQQFIDECGNYPAIGIPTDQDKWLKVLKEDLPTNIQPLDSHGIIPTFSETHTGDNNPRKFEDCVLEYASPLDSKTIGDNFYGSLTVSEAEVVPVYNFYIKQYEAILSQSNPANEPTESMLPSLYSFLSVAENEGNKITRDANGDVDPNSIDTVFEKHITLENSIKETFVSTPVTYNVGGQQKPTNVEISEGQYFDKYAYAFANRVRNPPPTTPEPLPGLEGLNVERPAMRQLGGDRQRELSSQLSSQFAGGYSVSDRFKNQIVPMSSIDMFSSFNEMANRFPMYCQINFSTSNTLNSEVVKMFEDTEMTAMFMKDFVDGKFGQSEKMDFNFLTTDGLPFIPEASSYITESHKPDRSLPAQSVLAGGLDSWNLLSSDGWLQWLQNNHGADNVDSGVFLGKFNREIINALNNPASTMVRNLMFTVFKAKLSQLVEEKTRTWKDMVGGRFDDVFYESKPAYHETVFYVVEKWAADNSGSPMGTEPLQNFYFPNSTQLDKHHFTDTQVKYGKRYVYRIYAMEMVFGTKYWYQLDQAPVANNTQWHTQFAEDQARICVLTEPSLKMVKVPYFQKEVIMMDDPPVFPDVDVITYRNVRNQILFWLTGNSGEYTLNPILIQPNDEKVISNIRLSQEVGANEPIRFKGDDQARFFEVFRTDKKPTTYADFKGTKIAHIDTGVNLAQYCNLSTSGEWIDKTIEPNKKYYYTFRTIDNHGHFSNPSPVYELEMVYDGYAPFLLRKVYFLEENPPPPQKPVKKFTKYIHIKPSIPQRVVNEIDSGLKNPAGEKLVDTDGGLTAKGDSDWVVLGRTEQPLWQKSLKVRIISKKTGKKIDLNVKFKNTHTKLDNGGNNNLC